MEPKRPDHNRQVRRENERLHEQVANLQLGTQKAKDSRLAALNLLEDATLAWELAEKTGAALRESEHELQLRDAELGLVQRAGGVAGVNIDLAGGYVGRRSAEYRRLHGLAEDVVEEQHADWQRRVHPEDRERADRTLRDALVGPGTTYESEYRIIRPCDGEERWILAKADIERDEHGQPVRLIGAHIDITHRKGMEEALRENEERLRALFDGMAEAFVIQEAILDHRGQAVDFRYLDHNPAFVRETGLTNAIGRTVRELIPDLEPIWIERYAEVLRTGESAKFQASLGAIGRWLDVSATRLGGLGSLRVAIIFSDITERKRSEEALRLSEEKYRTLFDSIDQGFCIIEVLFDAGGAPLDYRFLEANPAFETQTGLTGAIGRTMRELVPNHEQHWFEIYGRVAQTGEPVRFENVAESLGHFYEVNAFRVGAPGENRVAVLFHDISDRKAVADAMRASEETLQLVFESAREYAIVTMDLQRNVTMWNTGAERLLGFSEAEIIGRPADVIFTPEDRAAGAPVEEATGALRDGQAADERWHQRKDGSRFWGSGLMMAMHDAKGESIGLLKIFRDHTDVRAAQKAIEESREQLVEALEENEQARVLVEAASQAKDHFLAVLSHELRTPLSPILMTLKTLDRRSDVTDPVRDQLEVIRRNVRVEAHLIDDLLDVTRIGRGKFDLTRRPLELHRVIRDALETVGADVEAKSQILTHALDATNTELDGDATRLQQAVWNLLKNASKFTPSGGTVHLATRNEAGVVVIEVSDTGIGIDPQACSLIFDPFIQGGRTIERRFGGLGLGLAISKAIVEAHDGRIQAASSGENQGATFTIKLPLQDGGGNP